MMLVNATLAIGVIVYEGVTVLDFAGPATYLELLPPMAGVPVEFYTVSTQVGPLQGHRFVPLYSSNTYEDAPDHMDILVIPGGGPVVDELILNTTVIDYIRDIADQATDVLSVCTGGNLLGATGLLDGKNATTNKKKFDKIAGNHPNVNWIRHARWVEEGKWWTSSGVAAGMDMANAYITNRFGADVAASISEMLEYVPSTDPSNDPFDKTTPASPIVSSLVN